MRCPQDTSDPSTFWKQNDCLFVDRVLIPFMGYTIRTPGWRYTEWTRWNGSSLLPDWTKEGLVGVELYSHPAGDLQVGFDEYENRNEAVANPKVVAGLRKLLREAIGNQTRIDSLASTGQGY
eukprot:TRINITY_DN3900_c0_g7_i1.p1 TRINITY_DN3900_c0_g7~~TRINITY_DN3900_c0_g7_i1.p1  ORF type:complete len:122 (+),score=18.40 TRINITY_DN3900_c0_g7_i1:175-540(+)